MSFWKPFRYLYIKADCLIAKHIPQGDTKKTIGFYKLWSIAYDFLIKLDGAYIRGLQKMIKSTIRDNDIVLEIGCGTGLGTIYASKIAKKITGIDISPHMIKKLEKKIKKNDQKNIEIIQGSFPEALNQQHIFDSVISSHAIVHSTQEQRKNIYKHIFNLLKKGGRLGLFSSQGEIAPMFETKDEIVANLKLAGFQDYKIEDVSDIYRIIVAEKTYRLSAK